MPHLSIDFETLATGPAAKVLSLGAVLFDNTTILKELYWVFNPDFQVDRAVDLDTLAWWDKQSTEARTIFEECKNGLDPLEPLKELIKECTGIGKINVWSNGASFDIPILEHLFVQYNLKAPWKYWDHRCYRTLKALFPIEKGLQNALKHNALEDAKFQALGVINFFKMRTP